jgi:UDP-N-acetylmuramoyl-L-alanyl-D-glutamate--2,6-diaminopimelate ligase
MTLNSREVRPGSLFFALPGRTAHGLDYAVEAAARGASVVLFEPGAASAAPKLPATVFVAAIPGLRDLLGRIADRFFDRPSAQLRITGITGTNGKTTCAYLLAQCLERLGSSAAYIGTIGWGRIDALAPPTLTTPDVVSLHRELAALRDAGVREVALEVSSQALDQDRVAGVRLHSAAFTNLTRDHLDYHASMQAYGAAKLRLFDAAGLQDIIVNVGDAFGREFVERYAGPVRVTAVWIGASAGGTGAGPEGAGAVAGRSGAGRSGAGRSGAGRSGAGRSGAGAGWVALRAGRTVHGEAVTLDQHGLSMQLRGSCGETALQTKLLGRFNAENSLVVIGCLLTLGVPLGDAARVLGACVAPPGRMEVVAPGVAHKPMVVIDYAHTPDALAKALGALREHCAGALWCVFGCGGDRDPGKRRVMGAIADELADRIIVTDDNPRSENPQVITQAILQGITSHTPRVIHDRGAAIAAALTEARGEDVVLIAGKGHEDYQIHGATRRSFSDRREALRHLGAPA